MIGIQKLAVSLDLEGNHFAVGELVLSQRQIYFRYKPEFLQSGLNISPLKLSLNSAIVSAPKEPFDGLFGVFNDSLPDGWGRLLLDRTLSSRGIEPSRINPMDRLAFVGSKGMGALIYQPETEQDKTTGPIPDLDSIATEMDLVLKGNSSEVIEELFRLGGSSGGARPKIFAGYSPRTGELIHGIHEQLPDDYEDWIIKFPSSSDSPDIANIEFTYHRMALLAGIEMSTCKLFEGKSGRMYFGTKRFDRINRQRLHVHTASGMMHDNFRLSTMDYGHLMDCAFRLEKHVAAYEKVFRLAAFNVYLHNRDDHSKNFSFLMDASGRWKFAPAYDLTFSYSAYGFHSTMIAGESKNPGRTDLLKLADHFGLKSAPAIIEQVKYAASQWDSLSRDNGVSNESRTRIQKVINQRND